MPLPDNFQSAVFSRTYGSAASDRAERAADAAAAEIIAENIRIAAVFAEAKAKLLAIGAPAYYMARGYDFEDIAATLDDMAPKFDDVTRSRVAEFTLENQRNAIREGV